MALHLQAPWNPEGLTYVDDCGDIEECDGCGEPLPDIRYTLGAGYEYCTLNCVLKHTGIECRCCGEWSLGTGHICDDCLEGCQCCGARAQVYCLNEEGETQIVPICKKCEEIQ